MARSSRSPSRLDLPALLAEHRYILLYDGVCGLCNRTVQWILRRDSDGPMRFATLQGPVGREALRRLPQLAVVDSVILLHPEGAWIKSTAALEIIRYVGGVWTLALVGYLCPRALRDWVYDSVARRRYARFGKLESCPLPSPAQRSRFLDP
ncbi:MAG: DCC1-like thiol-disulfide oxidoreductase family protein [Gemmatimonadaceae bacterium]